VTFQLSRLRRLLSVLGDPRTPKLPRLAVLFAIAYLISPIDAVPDFMVPVVGFLDDLVVLWLSLGWLFKSAPRTEAPGAAAIEEPPPSERSAP
jgi:uncharacterized membrane protein YkvA (DUF1232 family)